jgi:hypothetical protein
VRALGGAVRGAVRAVGGIPAPLFWRALYRVLAGRVAVGATARLLRLLERRRPGAGGFVLDRIGDLCAWSGWPSQSPNWTNLDVSRFITRARRDLYQPEVRAKRSRRARRGQPLRIGAVGPFAGLLSFSAPSHFAPEAFRSTSQPVDPVLFDLTFDGRRASYLERLVSEYHLLAADAEPVDIAAAIDAAELDVLLLLAPPKPHEIVDRVDVPCVVHVCTGSDILHNPKVDFHVYVQPEADYFPRDNRMFCGTSRAYFGDEVVYPGFLLYDRRGIDLKAARPWAQREPLIVQHGSLYKAASAPYLDTVFDLLEDDSQLEFVLVGKDDGSALDSIRAHARRRGVEDRVHYEGAFSAVRNEDGEHDDAGAAKLLDLLGRARLAPDPWPLGGASARAEAYAMGAPTTHMAVSFDRDSWGRRQHSIIEVLALNVPRASATTPEAYRELCRRCLYKGAHADAVQADQLRIAERVTDPSEYWRQIVEFYVDWETRFARPLR